MRLAPRPGMTAAHRIPWADLLVLQELDVQWERLREKLGLAATLMDDAHRHLADDAARARRGQAATESRLEELAEERRAVQARLPSHALEAYQQVRRAVTTPPWVVLITDRACAACATPVRHAGAVTGSLRRCAGCSRLLLLPTLSEARG
ncbi:MAG: hypothetical protein AB2A00_43200 [Myxococcota bacterium]